MTVRIFLCFVLSVLLTGFVFCEVWAKSDGDNNSTSAANGNGRAWVFDCGGKYMKVDIISGRIVARGVVGKIVPGGRFDGCLIEGIKEDPNTGMLYAIMPRERTEDERGKRHYRLVKLNKATLKITETHEITPSLEFIPSFFFDPNKNELVLNYLSTSTASAKPQGVLERYSLPHLQKQLIKNPTESILIGGQVTHLNKRGQILDGVSILDANGIEREKIDGKSLLNDNITHAFSGLYRSGAHGVKYLDITLADSAENRMVFVVAADSASDRSPKGGGVVVYDVFSRHVVSHFITSYQVTPFAGLPGTPTVHLTPEGKSVVIEQYEWDWPKTNGAENRLERIKTGNLRVYNADTGLLVGEIFLSPRPGLSGHVINFSKDGKFLYYGSYNKLYVVDLNNLKVTSTIDLDDGFTPIKVLLATDT
ncbi:MAG: hypothetical protein A4E53_00645 [Pelotomaculum sp. PtaB.Bin104]|nr:MAG: hypothetical protein A4E53_00645 [Pelotomaculum sp. PtaB.Bin104]